MTKESEKPKEIDKSIENHPNVQELIAATPAKKLIDPKLKQEISNLINSGTTENKMKALEIIENRHDEISGFFLLNTLENLQKDSDEAVQVKAKNLSEKNLGYDIKGISMPFGNLGKIYEGTFSKLATDLALTSTVFTQMQDIAKITRNSLDIPICALDLGIGKDFAKLHTILSDDLPGLQIQFGIGKDFPKLHTVLSDDLPGLQIQFGIGKDFPKLHTVLSDDLPGLQIQFPDFSPILTTTEIVAPILDRNNQQLTIPEALGKSVSEVENELDTAIRSNTDVIFNYEGYQLIVLLERFLRENIHERICVPFEDTLTERIDPIIINNWESRKKREENNPLLDGKYRLIDHCDFSDFRKILEKEENCQVFSDILNSRQLRIVISKLDELEPIRNKIAHSKPLTKREFDKLKMYAEDMVRLFKK